MILLKQKRDIEMNCKEEFLNEISGHELLSAEIQYDDIPKTILLPVGFTNIDYERFLKELDFEYDFGCFGVISYKDGTWSWV